MNLPICAFMAAQFATLPTPAFENYCERNPVACMTTGSTNRINLDQGLLSRVQAVNTFVNHSVAQKTDKEIFGIDDYWEIAEKQGDCEDIALRKQKELVKEGIPLSDLLLTVVKEPSGTGHAVLTLRTNQGDYVLDNQTDDIKLWYNTPYKFYARQSYRDYKLWLKIDGCTK